VRSASTIVFLLALLAASIGVAIWAWQQMGEVEISGHGLVALGLGAVVTCALGSGLMALLFFSHRRGYDERAHDAERHFRDRSSDLGDGR
jgi:hypothetical protein